MRKLLLTLSIVAGVHAISQKPTLVFEDTVVEGNMIRLSSLNYHASNRFNNELTDKFVFGGTITEDIKENAQNRLKRVNTIGAQAVQEFDVLIGSVSPLGFDNYGLIVSASDQHLAAANIATDLFGVALFGNANYVGDTLDFSSTHFQYQHFQKIGFGLFDKRTLSSLRISYVAGSKEIEGQLTDAWMYSQVDTVSLMLEGSGFRTNRFYPYWAFQGSGFSIDLNYNFSYVNKKGFTQAINLRINNLGMIFWNEDAHRYAVDSLTNYTGFDIQDFINNEDGVSPTYNFTDTLGVFQDQRKNISSLPIEFTLQKLPLRSSAQKLQYLIGFKTILIPDYFPYMFGGLYYQPSESFSVSTRASYGGFGGLQWGLNLNYWIKNYAYLSLGTFDMIGNISATSGFGRSLNFSAHFKI